MSRAANRMAAGFVQARRGALLKWLDRQPEAARPALLAELDGRGTPEATALAAELRERWGING
jgi:hypothetical protein